MVEVMKIMVTSFKTSYTCTATLSAPNPAVGHHQPMPPLEKGMANHFSILALRTPMNSMKRQKEDTER